MVKTRIPPTRRKRGAPRQRLAMTDAAQILDLVAGALCKGKLLNAISIMHNAPRARLTTAESNPIYTGLVGMYCNGTVVKRGLWEVLGQ